MEGDETVKRLLQEGVTVSPSALNIFLEKKLDIETLVETCRRQGVWYLEESFIEEYLLRPAEASELVRSEVCRKKGLPAKDIEARIEFDANHDVTGKSTCSGAIEDFYDYFNERFRITKRVLKSRVEYADATTIEGLKASGGNGKIICMVLEKTETNAGNLLMTVEDPTGELTAYVNNNDEKLKGVYGSLMPDEILGVKGLLKNNLFIANEITQPDIPISRKINYADEEVYAAFISDIHVGSYLFLEKEFKAFLDWVNWCGANPEAAEKLKYICVAGDLVDGIGIYPKQERELTIPDIYKQYDFLAMLLEQIPSHIKIILGVGNHDAVRLADPQPALAEDIAPRLHAMENVTLVGSPARFRLHGVEVLMYHGNTLDGMIKNIPGTSYAEPEKPMIEYLKRRSLAPSYGIDGIAPEKQDYMFIDRVPDILHCGHVHTVGVGKYKGVTILNSGTWQGKTKYQQELGHQPTPARVPLVNLQNHQVRVLDFSIG